MPFAGQCVQWSQQRVGEAPRIMLGEPASVGFSVRVTCVVANFGWSLTIATITDATVRFGCSDAVQKERICQRRVEIFSSTKRCEQYIKIFLTYENASHRIAHKRSEKGRNDNKA